MALKELVIHPISFLPMIFQVLEMLLDHNRNIPIKLILTKLATKK